MKSLLSLWKKNWLYFVAFLTPWIIVMAKAFFYDGWPLGYYTLISGDTREQLVPFAYEIWDKFHTGSGFKYTWNLGGGCDFGAVIGYYFSPFTLLLLISSKDFIIDMVQIIMLLKWSCAGVAMVYFFYNTRFNTLIVHKKAVSFFLGMAFVLSNSQINFVRYIQFTDITICFPILLLLIERMVENKKWILYCFILSFCMFSNLYLSFQLCVFLFIWFLFQLDSKVEDKFKKSIIFFGSSLLSALIAVSSVVNTFALSSTRLDNIGESYRLTIMKNWQMAFNKFFKQFFIFSKIEIPQENTPNIYFSIIALVMVGFVLFINISRKRKFFLIAGVLFMSASYFNGFLNLAWHIFTPPNGVYNRFSNYFIFMMLLAVLYVFIYLEDVGLKNVIIIGCFLITASVYTFINIEHFDNYIVYIVTALLLVLYILLFILFCRRSIKYKNMILIIVVFGMLELSVNSFYQMLYQYHSVDYSYNSYELNYIDLVNKCDMQTGERLSATTMLPNIGLLSSKQCISGFASSINGNMLKLLEQLGLGVNGSVSYALKGASPLLNLLFNVRYYVAENEMGSSDVYLIDTIDETSLYRTERLAGLGYMVDQDIENWDIFDDNNCFEKQNLFIKHSTGENGNIFTVINPDVKCINIVGEEIDRDETYIGKNAYVYTYDAEYGDENDSIQIEFYADEDMDLYVDARNNSGGVISVFLDDDMVANDNRTFKRVTYHIGNVKKGQKVVMTVVYNSEFSKGISLSTFFRFAKFDEEAYSKVYEMLSKNVYNIETMDSEYIKGTIKADEDGIMMTSIQANVGFDTYVDGKKTECKTIGGALIGVPIAKGEHVVEFKYVGVTPIYGKIISLCGVILYLILCVVQFVKQRNNNNNSNNIITAEA